MSDWMEYMKSGDFESAWRLADGHEPPTPVFAGKRVLIRCLHGLGDTIQFIRYARELKRAGALSVTAQMHPELVGLVSTAPGLDRAVTWDRRPEDAPACDIDIEVMQLPRAFRTRVATIPAEVPYLAVSRPGRASGIGLIWASSAWDTSRSIPLREILPALAATGVRVCSLQHGPEHAQAIGCDGIRYSGEQSSDLLDTAADIAALDLLIAVDTMPAHLAGALGRPVWVLLKHDPDWRWMRERPDSPWYPGMRLFRQHREGDWSQVVRDVARELERLYFPGPMRDVPIAMSS